MCANKIPIIFHNIIALQGGNYIQYKCLVNLTLTAKKIIVMLLCIFTVVKLRREIFVPAFIFHLLLSARQLDL